MSMSYMFKGIYWFEVEDSDAIFDVQPTDDDVQISLLALTGIWTSRTLQL